MNNLNVYISVEDGICYLDVSQVKVRGWTDTMIKRFLPKHDAYLDGGHWYNGGVKRAYEFARVCEIEATDEFKEVMRKSLSRRKADEAKLASLEEARTQQASAVVEFKRQHSSD